MWPYNVHIESNCLQLSNILHEANGKQMASKIKFTILDYSSKNSITKSMGGSNAVLYVYRKQQHKMQYLLDLVDKIVKNLWNWYRECFYYQ